MPLTTVYRKSPEVVASFDFEDIQAGEGFIEYDLYQSTDSSATTNKMTRNPLASEPAFKGHTRGASASGSETFSFETSAFNLSMTLRGTALAQFSHCAQSGVATGAKTKMALKLQKNSTDITSSVETPERVTAANTIAKTEVLLLPLSSATIIKPGDKLVLHVTWTTTGSESENNSFIFGTDPLNKDRSQTGAVTATLTAANNPTYFKVRAPFKIDI